MFLLNNAQTKYFMWLADDDEITENYIFKCLNELESDCKLMGVCGKWYLMQNDKSGMVMPPQNFLFKSAILRLAKYIWKSNDAFFYGIHRTETLKKGKFTKYFWPNRDEILNWAYVFLINLIIEGKVKTIEDNDVLFINHDYTSKNYGQIGTGVFCVFKNIVRRLNVHYLYLSRIRERLGLKIVLVLFPISFFSIMSELIFSFYRSIRLFCSRLLKKMDTLW